jgi:hypothetical protein
LRVILVVHDVSRWPAVDPPLEIVSADTYLTSPRFGGQLEDGLRIANLCPSYRPQSAGWFVSLLAVARNARVWPAVSALEELTHRTFLRTLGEATERCAEDQWGPARERETRRVVSRFGRAEGLADDEVAAQLFALSRIPIAEARFAGTGGRWVLQSFSPLNPDDLSAADRAELVEAARLELAQGARKPRAEAQRFDLAILHDDREEEPPSNQAALIAFMRAAEAAGFRPELIGESDECRLLDFDALFIRQVTRIAHHTYRFARRAAAAGMAVLDDPQSILRCKNKLYIYHTFEHHHVPRPRTRVITRRTFESVVSEITWPCLLKPADG